MLDFRPTVDHTAVVTPLMVLADLKPSGARNAGVCRFRT